MSILDRITDTARELTAPAQKALVDLHPEILDRVHVMTVTGGTEQTPSTYSYLSALSDNESHVWVRKAVTIIANNLSALPVMVERDGEDLPEHPLLGLLESTTPLTQLWTQWVIDMLLGGEEGWELVKSMGGKYVELWPRQPHHINVIPDTKLKRYYKPAEYRIEDGAGPSYILPVNELLHFKFYNPRNPWRGLSVISAVRQSIAIDQFAQAWSRLFFTNSARPDYAIIAPAGLTPSEREDIEKKLMQKFGGVGNTHKPIVLEQGVSDVKVLTFPPKDMEWTEQRGMSRDEIGGMFGVPDILMGFGNDSYDTEVKRTAALQVLYTLTLMPLATLRDISITRYFRQVGMLAQNEKLMTDYRDVAALKEDLNDGWKREAEQLDRGAITINEWRIENGKDPVPWGDVPFAPQAQSPVGMSLANAKRERWKVVRAPQLKAKDDRPDVRAKYERELAGHVKRAADSGRGFADEHEKLVRFYAPLIYDAGLIAAGVDLEDIDEEEEAEDSGIILLWIDGQLKHLKEFSAAAAGIAGLETGDEKRAALAGMLERVGLWGAALAWLGGKAYMTRNENLSKWFLGNTEKHCSDCLAYSNEAAKPAKVWARNDKLPQSPDLECKGYNCDCRIENVETGEVYFP